MAIIVKNLVDFPCKSLLYYYNRFVWELVYRRISEKHDIVLL